MTVLSAGVRRFVERDANTGRIWARLGPSRPAGWAVGREAVALGKLAWGLQTGFFMQRTWAPLSCPFT